MSDASAVIPSPPQLLEKEANSSIAPGVGVWWSRVDSVCRGADIRRTN